MLKLFQTRIMIALDVIKTVRAETTTVLTTEFNLSVNCALELADGKVATEPRQNNTAFTVPSS